MSNQFVINRLRSKPVTYSIEISHLVIDGEWNMGIRLHNIATMDDENRSRIAADLRQAAELVEGAQWEQPS